MCIGNAEATVNVESIHPRTARFLQNISTASVASRGRVPLCLDPGNSHGGHLGSFPSFHLLLATHDLEDGANLKRERAVREEPAFGILVLGVA
jgi:hypothetical protein